MHHDSMLKYIMPVPMVHCWSQYGALCCRLFLFRDDDLLGLLKDWAPTLTPDVASSSEESWIQRVPKHTTISKELHRRQSSWPPEDKSKSGIILHSRLNLCQFYEACVCVDLYCEYVKVLLMVLLSGIYPKTMLIVTLGWANMRLLFDGTFSNSCAHTPKRSPIYFIPMSGAEWFIDTHQHVLDVVCCGIYCRMSRRRLHNMLEPPILEGPFGIR